MSQSEAIHTCGNCVHNDMCMAANAALTLTNRLSELAAKQVPESAYAVGARSREDLGLLAAKYCMGWLYDRKEDEC